jgi:ABC-type lipoprotein release transport system permease subunit
MSLLTLLFRNLTFRVLTHAAICLGVAIGTAVLTGALLVGDSLRGSLRALALERLGGIEAALLSDRPFRSELAQALRQGPEPARVVPALVLRGSALVRGADGSTTARAGGVQVVGISSDFWPLFGLHKSDLEDSVLVNQPLADALGIQAGDRLEIRLGKVEMIPTDSLLGRRSDDPGLTLEASPVAEILPARGVGRFTLGTQQQIPRIAYVPIDRVQRRLRESVGLTHPANALLVAWKRENGPTGDSQSENHRLEALQARLDDVAELTDFGLELKTDVTGKRYFSLETRRLILEPSVVERVVQAAREAGWDVQPTLSYLANVILDEGDLSASVASSVASAASPTPFEMARLARSATRYVPYSVVTALQPDAPPPWGPLTLVDGKPAPRLEPDEILLSEWAATDLWPDRDWSNRVGQSLVTLHYFLEGDGRLLAEGCQAFRLAGVVRMDEYSADRSLTPEFPGLRGTRIRDWKPPFPAEQWHPEWVRERDEDYWRRHRVAPKAFVHPETARRLWSSRYGDYTSLRFAIPSAVAGDPELIEQKRRELTALVRTTLPAREMGLRFLPVKAQALQAASSSTAQMFGWLFVGFSFFLIISAMLLVVLLFRLGVDQRGREIGLLYAVGFQARTVRRLLLSEGLLLAVLGAAVGVAAAWGYAWLVVQFLNHSWQASLQTSFLQFHVAASDPLLGPWPYPSLSLGWLLSVVIGMISILWAGRGLRRIEPRELLTGGFSLDSQLQRRGWGAAAVAVIGFCLALVLAACSFAVPQSSAPPLFFGSGTALLIGGLGLVTWYLRRPEAESVRGHGWPAVVRLGAANSRRRVGRSMLTAGLLACATFLILAVESFRKDASEANREDLDSGTGGFALVAESDVPMPFEPNSTDSRRALLPDVPTDQFDKLEKQLSGCSIIALRLRPGDDVSCLNLYTPLQPRIVGISPRFTERGGFGCEAWDKLAARFGTDSHESSPIPILADDHTAQWVLHKTVGDVWTIIDERGRDVPVQLVGLLHGSLFQSELLMAETDFRRLFPSQGGYRFFLVETPKSTAATAAQALEQLFGESYGLIVTPSRERLAGFHAVENTYLSTFQLLGAFGLLLGTAGLGVVLFRNVLERRGELALLRALGWSMADLRRLVMAETSFLILVGLVLGTAAALVAVLPHLLDRLSSVPWAGLIGLLALVAVVGLVSSRLAVAIALRTPLLPALRRE